MLALLAESTQMTRPKLKRAPLCDQLDTLLALHRMLVEVSMRIYGVSEAHRRSMRKQNRRLHDLVRLCFPRLPAAVSGVKQTRAPFGPPKAGQSRISARTC